MTIRLLLLPSILMSYCVQIRAGDFDPFSMVPDKSVIKKECSECGYGNFIFRSKKQKGCVYVRDTLAKFNEPDPKPGFVETFFWMMLGPNGKDLMVDLARSGNEK